MISVVIPVRNAASTIKKSIQSVIEQEIDDMEIICVVNGTSDDTEKIIKSIDDKRIKLLYSQPGIVPALNEGIRSARGEFIARQDSDDVWMKSKLLKQINFLKHNPEIDILGTQLSVVDKDGSFVRKTSYPTDNTKIIGNLLSGENSIGHPSVIFRRKILDKCAGYFDLFPFAEDMDLWIRCIPWFKFANLDDALVQYTHVPNAGYNPHVPKIVAQWYRTIYGVSQ